MSRFRSYSPEQAYLVPPSVKDILPEGHLCFLVRQVIAKLDLSKFEEEYSREGGELYAPEMMLSVWLYAYARGLSSGRRLERKIQEDLPLRYLAGGQHPDHWALSAFRRRHRRGINDVFTQVLELIRDAQLGRLGTVAVDSTPIKADNGRQRVDTRKRLRRDRAKYRRQIRRWQRQCEQADSEEGAAYARGQVQRFQAQLAQCPGRLQQLKKSGQERLPRTDADARVLRKRGQSVIGYSGEIAASQDHFIVAERVTQQKNDNAGIVPMVEEVERQCGERPGKVLADAGYFSTENLEALREQGIDAYIPDSNLARELNLGKRARGVGSRPVRSPVIKAMRQKLRSAEGRATYDRRKGMVEPVFGTLKAQRNLARFRLRGLAKVGIEFTLACLAYNLTRFQQARGKGKPAIDQA